MNLVYYLAVKISIDMITMQLLKSRTCSSQLLFSIWVQKSDFSDSGFRAPINSSNDLAT